MSIFNDPKFLDELLKIAQTAPSARQQRIQQEQQTANLPNELDQLSEQADQSQEELRKTVRDISKPELRNQEYLDPIMSEIYKNGPDGKPQEPNALRIADALLVDLQRKFDPDSAPKSGTLLTSAYPDKPIELKKENLRTLGDFVRWAANDGISYSGKLVASRQPIDDGILYNSLPDDRSQRDNKNQPVTEQFYLSKSLITPVLEYLRDSEQAHTDKVFQVMLGGMIRDANAFFARAGLTTIDERKKKDPGPEGIDQAEVVDGFTTTVLKANNPLEGLDNSPYLIDPQVPLRIKDLLSYNTLYAWLTKMSYSDGTQDKPVIGSVQEPSDPCTAIHVMYQRATRLVAAYKNGEADQQKPGYSKAVTYYLEQITKIGPRFTGPDGSACAVTTIGTVDKKKDITKTTDEDKKDSDKKTPGGISGVDLRNKINETCQLFPLRREDVSLDRINKFFTSYTEIVSPDRKSSLTNTYQQYSQAVSNLRATLSNASLQEFSLSINLDSIMRSWLKPPQGNHVINCLEALQQVVDAAEQSMRLFKTQYADDATRPMLAKDQIAALEFQIGTSSSSLAQRNKVFLEGLERQFISKNGRS